MSGAILDAVMRGCSIIDLGRPLFDGMPQSPNHPAFLHAYPARHGDSIRSGGLSAANDVVVTGTHVGTHVDSLAHISQAGHVFGGVASEDDLVGGKYLRLGVQIVDPIVTRGLVLDIPAVRGVECLDAGSEVTVEDCKAALQLFGGSIRRGDVVLIRTGWGMHFQDPLKYVGQVSGAPGVGEMCAKWLAGEGIIATGADTIAYDCILAGMGHSMLPAHRVLLVEAGIYIIETLDLEELCAIEQYEFVFMMSPLAIVGATASPVRPLAILDV